MQKVNTKKNTKANTKVNTKAQSERKQMSNVELEHFQVGGGRVLPGLGNEEQTQ